MEELFEVLVITITIGVFGILMAAGLIAGDREDEK